MDEPQTSQSQTFKRLVAGTALGLLVGLIGCVSENPIEGTYKKGVDGGQQAIQKAKDVQKKIDQDNLKLQEQQKQLEN
jgi:hypothetical protein